MSYTKPLQHLIDEFQKLPAQDFEHIAPKQPEKTATGKVLFYPTGHKHLMSSKSSKKNCSDRSTDSPIRW